MLPAVLPGALPRDSQHVPCSLQSPHFGEEARQVGAGCLVPSKYPATSQPPKHSSTTGTRLEALDTRGPELREHWVQASPSLLEPRFFHKPMHQEGIHKVGVGKNPKDGTPRIPESRTLTVCSPRFSTMRIVDAPFPRIHKLGPELHR